MMMWRCNGISYHGELRGSGKEAILLLHGFTGSHRNWTPFFPILEKSYRLLAIDLIGHGRTDAPFDWHRYGIKKTAHDLLSLVDQLEIERIHLVGYSMGGRVAITFAVLYPERVASLFLESTTAGLRTEAERKERQEQDRKLAQHIQVQGLESFINYWENLPLFETQRNLPVDVKRSIRQNRLSHQPIGLINSLLGMGTGSMPSYWEVLPSFTMPVQLVTGDKDVKFCKIAEEMQKINLRFNHIIIPNAGHGVHLEKPEEYRSLLQSFLSLT